VDVYQGLGEGGLILKCGGKLEIKNKKKELIHDAFTVVEYV
jgi:hypothetical protein